MDHASQGKHLRKPRILVAPLDWGLGHATRCIPVIWELVSQGAEVWLAGEGSQEKLLRAEFPELPFLPLPGYRVRYGKTAKGLMSKLFLQSPGILLTIRQENQWLRKAIAKHQFDAVISDNRFGLHHFSITSVFITHQLQIKSPWKWMEVFLQNRNYQYIRQFNECWVPDWAGVDNLAGELSHPPKMPATPTHYIGHLSRLQPVAVPAPGQKGHLFVVLSGPEPQRSQLEDKMVNELSHYPGTATVVRGLPASNSIIPSTNDIQFHNHLGTKDFEAEMQKAEYVISRSGYSTVMDLASVGKKSILIPTPGQPEQEYLGAYLMKKNFAVTVSQDEFSLMEILEKAKRFNYLTYSLENKTLPQMITAFLQRIISQA